ncbi:MAG: discoidin domain-containing protein [Verrucomicrobia bacterium]|nr:discoidin domain-containing protein [Verrucomicrobiota bacterium]
MKTSLNKLLAAVLLAAGPLADSAISASKPDAPFDYFVNNWNVVGLKDYPRGARVTPDNRLFLAGSNTTVQVRFGRTLTALSRQHGKLALNGWMPIMVIAAEDGPVRYEFTYWATPMPGVKDWKKAFDWPTESENFLVWVRYQAANHSDQSAEAKVDVRLDPKAPVHPNIEAPTKPAVDPSLHGSHSLAKVLSPGETVEGAARFAFFAQKDSAALNQADHRLWFQRTVEYWQDLEKSFATIQVPCRKATDTLKAAHVCQMIANDLGEVRGGEGFYDVFYIRDGAYQVMELEEAGMWDAARKSVELYLPRQRPDGRFESQAKQFDANGQAVWVLWQFHKMTADRAWLERVYPAMRRAVDWTIKVRRSAPADSPFAGVLPNAVADGEFLWDGKHHIVGYDFWNLRGLLCTADAARILGKKSEAEELTKESELYRQAIEAAWKRAGLAHFPPSWEKVGTHWGNTETLWPTELFARDDARVAALVKHVRGEFGGGFLEGTIRWLGQPDVIHPYMGAYTVMTDLVRGHHEQVVQDFSWYLLHSTAAHAFPEGIYYKRRYAWSETIPHVTGACNYAILLRHMLVHEEGDELHLLKAVPDWWLANGQEIRIEKLPTHFGMMGLTVRGTTRGVQVKLDKPTRQKPARMVLHLPENRPLEDTLDGVAVVTRTAQTMKWDFDTVIERYQKLRGGERNLTTDKPVTSSSALPGFPPEMANDGLRDSTDSYWATDIKSQNDPAPWWQVDLGAPTSVGRVVPVGFYGDKRSYGFTVDVSTDGSTWTQVADRRDNKEPATKDGYPCVFEPRPVRFIRVTLTHNSANTGRHLVEVMAFEK